MNFPNVKIGLGQATVFGLPISCNSIAGSLVDHAVSDLVSVTAKFHLTHWNSDTTKVI